MILRRNSTFPLILCVLLSLWYLLTFSGDALAQSLLSDRAWLEQNTEVTDETETVFRIEPAGQKTPLLPSDLLSAPTTLLEVETAQTESSVPNISTSSLTPPIPTLPLIEAEEDDRSFSGSFFSKYSRGFPKAIKIFPIMPPMTLLQKTNRLKHNRNGRTRNLPEFLCW